MKKPILEFSVIHFILPKSEQDLTFTYTSMIFMSLYSQMFTGRHLGNYIVVVVEYKDDEVTLS